jgi:hypothetical protein
LCEKSLKRICTVICTGGNGNGNSKKFYNNNINIGGVLIKLSFKSILRGLE